MTFAQRRNLLTTHFSERIPVVKRRMTVQETRQILALVLLQSYYSLHELKIELQNLSVPSLIYTIHRTVHSFVLIKAVILGFLILKPKLI